MDKVWFIIKQSEHIGPYDLDELQQFFENGKVDLNTAVWCSGMDAPCALDDVLDAMFKQDDEHYYEGEARRSTQIDSIEIEADSDFDEEFDDSELDDFFANREEEKPKIDPQSVSPNYQIEDEIELEEVETNFDLEEMSVATPPPIPNSPQESEELSDQVEINNEVAINDIVESEDEFSEDTSVNTSEQSLPPAARSKVISFFSSGARIAATIVLLTVSILIARVGLEFYEIYYQAFTRPAKMDLRSDVALKEFLKDAKKDEFKVEFSRDYSEFWIATKYPFDGRVKIEIRSLAGRSLAPAPIEVEALGLLEDKLIRVDQFRFNKGEKFYPGHYQISFEIINRFKKTYWIESILNLSHILRGDGEIVIGPYSAIELDEKIAQQRKAQSQADQRFLEEISQRFNTLNVILGEVKSQLLTLMRQVDPKNKAELVKKFEQNWTSGHGRFLSSFVLEGNQFFKSVQESNSNRVSYFAGLHGKLTQWCRQIGESSMAIISDLSNQSELKVYANPEYRQQVVGELEQVSGQISQEIQRLESQ